MMRPLLLLSLLLAPALSAAQSQFVKTPVRVDPCVNDLFFVDLPMGVGVDQIPRDFEANLERDLTALARTNYGWFCASNTCDLLRKPGRLVAQVERLLPRRDRSQVEERFLRVAFYYTPKPGTMTQAERLIVRDAAACAAIAGINTAVGELSVGADHPFYVGRSCTASGQQIERPIGRPIGRLTLKDGVDRSRLKPAVSADMQDWHLDRMGVDGPTRSTTPIVLIDTGVRDAIVPVEHWATPSEVLPAAYDRAGAPLPMPVLTRHPHGTEMAVAIRQVTDAPIFDMPVLGVNGRVPLGQIARAVDEAATRLGNQGAIINLSLGWAPEIERERKFQRGLCAVLEQPAGEAMRAVLARIRSAHPRVLVVAAGGNRARLGDRYISLARGRYQSTVSGGALETDAFYPGQWGLRSTGGGPTLLTVGAIQSTGRLAGMDQGQATLFAPGQHVYLNAPGEAPDDICAGGRTELAFPSTVTGSSIAAAFTSAVAARIWDRRPDATAQDAARLLYLAAEPMGVERDDDLMPYVGVSGIAGRSLHAGRLTKLLRVGAHRLRDCHSGGAAFTGPGVSPACHRALSNLGMDEQVRAESPSIGWPRARELQCLVRAGDASRLHLQAEGARVCASAPYEPMCLKPDLYSAGDAGPQPEYDPCDDCMLFELPDHRARMQGVINPGFPEGTLIEHPWLVVYWDDGFKATVDLTSTGQTWAPGKSIDISGLQLDLGGHELAKGNVFLSMTIKTTTQTRGTSSLSPVRVGD